MRTISGCDAYARAEDHLVERTNVGAISECPLQGLLQLFGFAQCPTHPCVYAVARSTYCVAVTLVGALTVVLLLANEVSVLMQPQRTEQVTQRAA